MEEFASFYQKRLGLQKALFKEIVHEDAMVAVVYKVVMPSGEELILKICEKADHYVREVFFLQQIRGLLAVPHIIDVVEPEEGVRGAVLMNCLPGHVMSLADFTGQVAYQAGEMLAILHLKRASSYGDPAKPCLVYKHPEELFRDKYGDVYEEVRFLPSELIEKGMKYIEEHIPFLATADGPCFVHRDFRPGNIVLHKV